MSSSRERLPGSTVSGTVTWPTLQVMLRSIRGEQQLVVTHYGEAVSEDGKRVTVYRVVAETPVPLEEFAHVVGRPREGEVEQERRAALDGETLRSLAGLSNEAVDRVLEEGGLDAGTLREEASRRDRALEALRAQASPGEPPSADEDDASQGSRELIEL